MASKYTGLLSAEQRALWTKEHSDNILRKMGYDLEGSLTIHEQFLLRYNEHLKKKLENNQNLPPVKRMKGRPVTLNPSFKTLYSRMYEERRKKKLLENKK